MQTIYPIRGLDPEYVKNSDNINKKVNKLDKNRQIYRGRK